MDDLTDTPMPDLPADADFAFMSDALDSLKVLYLIHCAEIHEDWEVTPDAWHEVMADLGRRHPDRMAQWAASFDHALTERAADIEQG